MLVHNGFVSVTGWVLQCSHHGNLNKVFLRLNATDQSYHSSFYTTGHRVLVKSALPCPYIEPIITMNPYNNNRQSYETHSLDNIKPTIIKIHYKRIACLSLIAIDPSTIDKLGVR